MAQYAVLGFDATSGTMLIQFAGWPVLNFNAPQDGTSYLSGQALEDAIQAMYPGTPPTSLSNLTGAGNITALVTVIPPPTPTIAQVIATLESAVQVHINSIAQKRGYDNGVSCASYATSTIPQFAADAVAFVAWRDSVWVACQQIENTDLAAVPPIIPTAADVIAALPAAPF